MEALKHVPGFLALFEQQRHCKPFLFLGFSQDEGTSVAGQHENERSKSSKKKKKKTTNNKNIPCLSGDAKVISHLQGPKQAAFPHFPFFRLLKPPAKPKKKEKQ